MSRMYQSYQGPTDPSLTHSLTEGYQPVSRIGEVVINSFIDSYEFTALPETISVADVAPTGTLLPAKKDEQPADEWNKLNQQAYEYVRDNTPPLSHTHTPTDDACLCFAEAAFPRVGDGASRHDLRVAQGP